MIYEIHHRLEYRYSSPVYLEPHLLHLLPRTDCGQRVKRFKLRIDPLPVQQTEIIDALGNPAHEACFTGLTDHLLLEASSLVEVTRDNPFGFLLRQSALALPISYSGPVHALLEPYFDKKKTEPVVADFATSIANQVGHQTIPFLSALCMEIYRRMNHVRREGEAWSAEKVLADGTGACRDVSMLFIACCRSQGLAARFTSGYSQEATASPEEPDELHAWAEVFLEGAGWIGFDTTEGLIIGDRHIAVASAPDIQATTPASGSFRRNAVTSKLITKVSVRPAGA